MFWPARSGFSFFLGLRCAGGVVAIVVLSFRARRGISRWPECASCRIQFRDQNGGSSLWGVAQGSEPCEERAPAVLGVPLAHGSSPKPPAAGRLPPPPWLLPLALRVTFAVAYRSAGPISSTSISKTVRRSPSRVS